MTWRRALLYVLTVLLTLSGGTARAQDSQNQSHPKFRSAIDVVSVTAVVRDRKGRFVRDLLPKDFIVAEAGESKRILDFRSESDGPVRLALLFDVSGSMRVGTKAVDARAAAHQVFSALRPIDEAAVFMFDTRLQRVHDFTSDVKALEASLDRMDPPYGQTSLYDAIDETARSVPFPDGSAARLPLRVAVVVLTDGIDTRSRLTPEQVTAVASGIDVPVYAIAVMSSIDEPPQSGATADGDATSALGNLAQRTGGTLFTASSPAHASVAARQIVDELRHQYVLAFEASGRPGWRPLEVRARDRGLIVRARAGYAAGGPTGNSSDEARWNAR